MELTKITTSNLYEFVKKNNLEIKNDFSLLILSGDLTDEFFENQLVNCVLKGKHIETLNKLQKAYDFFHFLSLYITERHGIVKGDNLTDKDIDINLMLESTSTLWNIRHLIQIKMDEEEKIHI